MINPNRRSECGEEGEMATDRIGANRAVRQESFLLYDADCGPCTRFMKAVKRADLRHKIIPVPLQSGFATSLVSRKLSRTRLKASFHLVEVSDENTEIFSAGDGLIQLISYMPFGFILSKPVARFKKARNAVRWFYLQATRFRSASKSCAI